MRFDFYLALVATRHIETTNSFFASGKESQGLVEIAFTTTANHLKCAGAECWPPLPCRLSQKSDAQVLYATSDNQFCGKTTAKAPFGFPKRTIRDKKIVARSFF